MTAQVQFNNSSSQLVALGLGVNEVASALWNSKQIGVIFPRTEDVGVFHILASQYNVNVRFVPAWLRYSILTRAMPMHGEDMRVTWGFTPIQDIKVDWLIGIASLVVLITRSIHSKDDITSLLERLIEGKIGGIVDSGTLEGRLPYYFRGLLRHFVQSTLDSHLDSLEHNTCRSYFAALAMNIGPLASRNNSKEHRFTVSRVISELFGTASMVEDPQSPSERLSDDFRQLKHQLRMHHTVDTAPAYIALAARAYGADCALEIMLGAGRRIRIPETHMTTPDTFFVRLWTSPFPRLNAHRNLRSYLRPDFDSAPQPRPHSNLRTQRLPTIREDYMLKTPYSWVEEQIEWANSL
jgi:hypothetical protein